MQAVLAHELGHLKCDHGVWLTAANVLALGTVSLLPIISDAVQEGLAAIMIPFIDSTSNAQGY